MTPINVTCVTRFGVIFSVMDCVALASNPAQCHNEISSCCLVCFPLARAGGIFWEVMGAPKGNQFWKARSKHGRDKIFSSPDVLWESCVEYFEWCEENPLFEVQAFAYQGVVTQEPIPKLRAMTIQGLCLFLDISLKTWNDYRNSETHKDFLQVVTRAESVIYQQKFTGASAGLLNPNIIARDLGLADKKDHTSSDGSMSPKPSVDTSQLSSAALDELMNAYKPDEN